MATPDNTPIEPQKIPPGGRTLMIIVLVVFALTACILNWQRFREDKLEQVIVTPVATPSATPAALPSPVVP